MSGSEARLVTARALLGTYIRAHQSLMPPSVQARLANSPEVIPERSLVDKRTGKPKRISKRIKDAIRLLLHGECKQVTTAAERVGMTRSHLSNMLSAPHVQVFIAQERARTIANASLRAAARLGELVDASSEHVSLDASKHVLSIQGVAPPERGAGPVNVNVAVGFVIDLSEGVSHAPGAVVEATATQVRDDAESADPQGLVGDTSRRSAAPEKAQR